MHIFLYTYTKISLPYNYFNYFPESLFSDISSTRKNTRWRNDREKPRARNNTKHLIHQMIAINCTQANYGDHLENVDFEWYRKAKDFNDRRSLIIHASYFIIDVILKRW